MILENCTEAKVLEDKISNSASHDLLAKDVENSEVSAPVSCSQSTCNKEATPTEVMDIDESLSSEEGNDEIMEEKSSDLIPDPSTDENGAKDSDYQCSSNCIEDEMNNDQLEKKSRSKCESTDKEIAEVERKSNDNEIQDLVSSVDTTSSANKDLGYKMLKATSKFFSPNKNCISSSMKSQEISLSPEEKATSYTIPDKNSQVTDKEISHVQPHKPHNEEIPATLETKSTQQYKRGSTSCKMSATDIEAHEKRGKEETAILTSNDKDKNGVICDEKNCLEPKQAQTTQPTSKSSSKPRSKIRTKPPVSSKTGTEHTLKKAEILLDARKARIAQMRGKAKAATLANSSKHKTTQQNRVKTTQQNRVNNNATAKTENRRKVMATEMRQKTNVEEKQIMSPMDTYEMSDIGESDIDSDSDSDSGSEFKEKSSKKKIPKWAQKANLIPALEKQFLVGEHRLDPDEIFPEVETCDLEAIFDKKKKRYMKRASTGNWT